VSEAEEIQIGGLTIGFLIEGSAEDGAPSIFEFGVTSGAKVPAAHRHDGYVETIYGLDGTLTWEVEGERVETGPGDVLRIPRGVAHSFHNVGEADAKALAIVSPGVLGPEYFREIAAVIASSDGPPDLTAIAAVMERHGLTPA
jgi:quercetin dioxygenase-like cupin family protein